MLPPYVPGLTRPVSVSEYATLTGASEAAVVASMRAYKIPASYARGEWWLSAPRNSEARLAQLRQAPRPNEIGQRTTQAKKQETAVKQRTKIKCVLWRVGSALALVIGIDHVAAVPPFPTAVSTPTESVQMAGQVKALEGKAPALIMAA